MSSLLGKLARRDELVEARGGPPRVGFEGPRLGPSDKGSKGTAERLDLETVAGPLGPHHVRRVFEPRARGYGRFSLEAACTADCRLLARLALEPKLEDLPPVGALFLDTETSGLGGGTGNRAFLVGMSWFDVARDAFVLEQLFLRDLDDEAALLDRVRERVEGAAFVVTYNGKSFDVPLLRTRMMLARVGPFPERPHVDLLHLARRVHDRRSWRMSLGVVEKRVLGFERGPDVGGEEVAMRYAHYVWSGDESCLEEVLTHNRFDVLSLVALFGHYGRGALPESEPFETPELSAMARALRRAGDLEWASSVADRAVQRGSEPTRPEDVGGGAHADASDALWTRARIAKSRGDKAGAVSDLERLLEHTDDADARLELAKLYEHFLGDPARALALVELGTGEPFDDLERRRERLLRKVLRKRR